MGHFPLFSIARGLIYVDIFHVSGESADDPKSPEITRFPSCSILGAFGGSTQPDLQLDVHSWVVFCDQGEYIQKKMLKEKDRTWLYLAGSVDALCSMNMYLLFPLSHFKFISQLRGCQAEPEMI